MAEIEEEIGHASLVGGGETSLHSHPGGGNGVNVKSGIKTASTGGNSVIFATPFASTPHVVLTVRGNINLRDCIYKVTSISTTGFSFEVDLGCSYIWIATDAGDP